MEKQSGKLILGGVTFELDDCKDTRLYVFESDEYEDTITISFDLKFRAEIFNGKEVSSYICINEHETHKSEISEIVGDTYSVDSPEEADEREDTLYIFEHEPFQKYSFTILEISGKMVHIQIAGTAITDGYAEPYQTADFSGDFWLRCE
ncbi:MAG: hypothetical protein K2O42_01115 [Oscillospiraceae bacterium]|nr:hypothetical protein [Oscillospiraceae bacterium]